MIDITRAQKIKGFMTNGDLEWLARAAQDKKIIVEIGCYLGRSTRAMADNTNGIIFAVDNFTTGGDHGAEASEPFEQKFAEHLFDHIRVNRVIPILLWHNHATKINVQPDFVFIDGSHEYEDVKRDIETWKEKLLPGGLLSGHDFNNGYPGVNQAVQELCPGFELPVRAAMEAGSIWYWRKS